MKKYDSGIYLGKFFPFQAGHLKTLNTICEVCNKVYLVFFCTEENERKLLDEILYPLDERIDDVRNIVKDKNVEIIKYFPSVGLRFPNDYLEIKQELFDIIGVNSIDVQIFGKDDEKLYKNYIYADKYIVGSNISVNGENLHASLIRQNYDRYKRFLHPIIRKRLDEKLKKQKYICVTGKSGSGKSTFSKILSDRLKDCVHLDIDKLAHEALKDNLVKVKITNIVGDSILDEFKNIDRKKLGQIVFNDKELKSTIYDITWEYMDRCIMSYNNNYVILDWYNIINKRYWNIATLRVLVDRDYRERREAVIKRDNITEEYFDLREKNSVSYDDVSIDLKINISDLDNLNDFIDFLS